MSIRNHINEIIKEYLGREKIYTQICEVISVDDSTRTCQVDPINGDAERKGRLQASLSLSEGLYIKPAVGSKVALTFINNQTGVITQFTEIDSFEVKISDKQINVDSSEISFNGGSNGGMVIPLSAVNRWNLIEQDVNDLKTVISGWTPIPNDGGAALKTALATWYGSSLTETQITDVENQDIKQ
jgi:hypothetical protein